MNEKKLEKELETYKELAKQDKTIDVASLMVNALQKHQANLIETKHKRLAYLASMAVPPVGYFLALNFYLSDKDDGPQAALMCVLLTTISIVLLIMLSKPLFSTPITAI